MERTIHIEDRKFASVAEAVAHYYRQGFHDFDTGRGTNRRIMRSGDLEVMITHVGLLDVDASLIQIVSQS